MDREQRIDEILKALDGASRAEASPFFYSKLRSRMESATLPRPLAWRLAGALAVVTLLNLLTLKALHHDNAASDARAQSIASEYSMTLPETY